MDGRPRRQVLLIVDDDVDLLDALAALFARRAPHLEVQTAASATEGLALLRQGPVDAILSDYRMPGMDGVSFLEAVREQAPLVPRLLMTGHADLGMALRAIQDARVLRLFTKPFDGEAVVAEVDRVMSARSSEGARQLAFSRMVHHLRQPSPGHGAPPDPEGTPAEETS